MKSSILCRFSHDPKTSYCTHIVLQSASRKELVGIESSMEGMKRKSDSYYDTAWRWIEDTYLKYFGENRTSYAVKGRGFFHDEGFDEG